MEEINRLNEKILKTMQSFLPLVETTLDSRFSKELKEKYKDIKELYKRLKPLEMFIQTPRNVTKTPQDRKGLPTLEPSSVKTKIDFNKKMFSNLPSYIKFEISFEALKDYFSQLEDLLIRLNRAFLTKDEIESVCKTDTGVVVSALLKTGLAMLTFEDNRVGYLFNLNS